MNTSKIIEIDGINYDVSSPNNETYRDLYIKSLGGDLNPYYQPKLSITQHNLDGYQIELKSDSEDFYYVEILDGDTVVYSTNLKSTMYSKLDRKYYTEWKTKVYQNDELVLETKLDLSNSRVFIVFESSALGDSLAWLPYCDEFSKKHNCHVVVSTFNNSLFTGQYPNLEFVNPGSTVNDIKALYRLGWFYNNSMEPTLPNLIPLQKTATNILGLEFKEIRPKLNFEPSERPIKEKYVTIGMSTTAGCKEWTYPNGWQILINKLNELGYKVAVIQKEPIGNFDNLLDWTGNKNFSTAMNQIYHSEFFIGLGSGLSWLSWAVGKHVVMISNFSEDGHEFTLDTTRITNKSVCNGCWNNPMFKFDKGDWNWCPEHKDTERQFECHKSITPEMVLNSIEHLLV